MQHGNILSRTLSYLFHPLLMPFYFALYIAFADSFIAYLLPIKMRIIVVSLLFFLTFLLPVSIIITLKRMGKYNIKTLFMDEPEERNIPYMIGASAMFLAFYLINEINVPLTQLLAANLLGATLLILSALIINLQWKISAHMIGIGGITAAVLYMHLFVIQASAFSLLLFIATGLVAYARLQTGSHNQAQVYVGYILGFAGMLAVQFIML